MNELFALNSEAIAKTNEITDIVRQKAWSEHSREGFVALLSASMEKLEQLKTVLEKIDKSLGEESVSHGVKEHLLELEKESKVLYRNLEMEKNKKPFPEDLLKGTGAQSEQYSSIEQRILSFLLKTRYLLERMQLQAKKQDSVLNEKSTARNLLDLLKNKENEIEALKQKYSEARKHALTGISQQDDSASMESEVNALARKLELGQNDLERAYLDSQKGIAEIQRGNLMLRKEVRELQQLFANYINKSLGLITQLKKERDYAKKIVLDIEHETMQLRSAYSRELLSLEETKIAAKREAEEKYSVKLKRVEKEAEQKQELTGQLQNMLQDREKKLSVLEEHNHKMRLLLKTKEKHDAVKKAFKQNSK